MVSLTTLGPLEPISSSRIADSLPVRFAFLVENVAVVFSSLLLPLLVLPLLLSVGFRFRSAGCWFVVVVVESDAIAAVIVGMSPMATRAPGHAPPPPPMSSPSRMWFGDATARRGTNPPPSEPVKPGTHRRI